MKILQQASVAQVPSLLFIGHLWGVALVCMVQRGSSPHHTHASSKEERGGHICPYKGTACKVHASFLLPSH